MVFFRDNFSKILTNAYCRATIVLLFLAYLTLAGIGFSRIKEGLNYDHSFRHNSSAGKYMDWNEKYFADYPHRVQIVIDEILDYSDPVVQKKVEGIVERFENESFCAGPHMTEHWLRAYKSFVNDPKMWLLVRGFNISNSEDFYYVLNNIFFKLPLIKRLSTDVAFNSNLTAVTASRFLIQTRNIRDSISEKNMLSSMYRIADTCGYKVLVYSLQFQFTEQLLLFRDICIQTVAASAVVMMIIFFVFVPDIKCAFFVSVCLVSVQIGVIGYMSFWNVNLNLFSLISLIMCVGFSVDFAAHISYAYVACKSKNGGEKIRHATFAAGMPILQGACSTVLGVFFLLFAPIYSLVVMFKLLFLIMVFAAAHALFLLPVLLSFGDLAIRETPSEPTSAVEEPEMQKLSNKCFQCKDLKAK